MGWDWWVYYEQPPEMINDVLEHLEVESEVSKNKTVKTPGGNGTSDPNPDSIFNFKEKVE